MVASDFSEDAFFRVAGGYGAFSINVSGVDATVVYIRNQAEHHRTRSFRHEYAAMLKKHGFAYDESMLV